MIKSTSQDVPWLTQKAMSPLAILSENLIQLLNV